VAEQDGQPVPKVIDFGLAKALHQRLTDQTMDTEIGQVLGTLEYMSPEQAEFDTLDEQGIREKRLGQVRRMSKGEASCAMGRGSDGMGGGNALFGGYPCNRTFGG
jgi:serine/threonine protein kinase